MQKLEAINTKQIVTESVEVKQVITESVARRVVKESADPVFKSSIARSLAEEFGYDLDERVTINPDGTTSGGLRPQPAASAPGQVTSGSGAPVTSGSGAPVQSGTAAPTADAAAAAKAKLSPAQLKWLGGADPTDPAIMARLKSAVPDAPGAAATPAPTPAQAAATPAQAAATPAAAPAIGTTAQGDDEGNTMITKPDGTVQVVGPDGNVIPAGGGKETPPGGATTPAAADPAVAATREKFKALMDKLEKTGGVTGSAPAPAAPTAPKKPTQVAPPKQPTTGGATKPADLSMIDKFRTSVGIPAGGTSPTGTKESVSFEDDKTLLAIKNIRY